MKIDRRTFLSGLLLAGAACSPRSRGIIVGSKNFTEQLILGELLALYLERHSTVERRFYLAGTYICHQALLAGRIDLYVEYTGTAVAAVLKERAAGDARQVYEQVKEQYLRRFGLEILQPLGFNNSFALVMRGDDASRFKLAKLSQLAEVAPHLRLGVGYEFLEREDGYKGLVRAYDLKFAEAPHVMDLGLLYRALQNHSVDIVAGNNTDGLIAALGLAVLEDDRHYFPPYDAVPVARPQMFERCPQARPALERLAGQITAEHMRAMNYAVDGQKQDAAEVAHRFIETQRLLTLSSPRRVSPGGDLA